jgi:hypothetical protein
MVAFDATVLCIVLHEHAGIPNDFRTGQPIEHAAERIDALIDELTKDGEQIVVPTPALCEALVFAGLDAPLYVEEMESKSCFKIVPFDKRAAIEIAIRTRAAIDLGDKKEEVQSPWQKVKYDRQIVAIARVEGASAIYSTDEHIHKHAQLWGVPVLSISDLPARPQKQQILPIGEIEDEQKAIDAGAAEVSGGGPGHAEGKATVETREGTKEPSAGEHKKKQEVAGELQGGPPLTPINSAETNGGIEAGAKGGLPTQSLPR